MAYRIIEGIKEGWRAYEVRPEKRGKYGGTFTTQDINEAYIYLAYLRNRYYQQKFQGEYFRVEEFYS